MENVKLNFVLLPDDFSPDPEKIKELADSIGEKGLMHEIIVRPSSKLGFFDVVVGKSRVAACKLLQMETIRAEVKQVSDDAALELSIHENLHRDNLPWWEQSVLIKKLHELRQEEHGGGKTGRPKKEEGKTGWGVRDTAEELGIALGAVSESIALADAVVSDPTLRNIKDRRTALRMVRAAAKRAEAELFQAAPVEFEVNSVYCGSAGEVLRRLPNSIFDACITDPPWIKFKDEKFVRDSETVPTFREIHRVLKADSFLYLFCGLEDYNDYAKLLPDFGFDVSKTPLIWHKTGHILSKGVKSWEYGRNFELILLAVKGNPALARAVQRGAVFPVDIVPTRSMVHPNEKPVALIREIIEDCTFSGAVILDPFAGSGSHLQAAKESGRRYVGIERDGEIHNAILKRLGLK